MVVTAHLRDVKGLPYAKAEGVQLPVGLLFPFLPGIRSSECQLTLGPACGRRCHCGDMMYVPKPTGDSVGPL